jgi:hypothetical protein
MSTQRLARLLLGDGLNTEASVRLPPRGRRWIGIFTGPEPGQQVWRSTGLTDRDAALALARRWEADSLRQRRARWKACRTSTHPSERLPGLTQAEVAAVLGLSQRAVRAIEQRAIRKLRNHTLLRQLWADLESLGARAPRQGGSDLTGPELAALFGLARTPSERRALLKVLAAIRGLNR